jgi:hypothetical protein
MCEDQMGEERRRICPIAQMLKQDVKSVRDAHSRCAAFPSRLSD